MQPKIISYIHLLLQVLLYLLLEEILKVCTFLLQFFRNCKQMQQKKTYIILEIMTKNWFHIKWYKLYIFFKGMNAAVRAVVRFGLYLGCKVYFIHEGLTQKRHLTLRCNMIYWPVSFDKICLKVEILRTCLWSTDWWWSYTSQGATGDTWFVVLCECVII